MGSERARPLRASGFEVVRARASDRDLAAIFDRLVEGYRALGDTLAEALARAASRVRSIEATMAGLGRTAFLGRPRPDLLPGLRQVAADRAVFSFVVDEAAGRVRILAVSFGADQGAARSSAPSQSLAAGRPRGPSMPLPPVSGR